jgi:hypothetical protein
LLIDEGKICSSVYVPRYIDFWQSREMSEWTTINKIKKRSVQRTPNLLVCYISYIPSSGHDLLVQVQARSLWKINLFRIFKPRILCFSFYLSLFNFISLPLFLVMPFPSALFVCPEVITLNFHFLLS